MTDKERELIERARTYHEEGCRQNPNGLGPPFVKQLADALEARLDAEGVVTEGPK